MSKMFYGLYDLANSAYTMIIITFVTSANCWQPTTRRSLLAMDRRTLWNYNCTHWTFHWSMGRQKTKRKNKFLTNFYFTLYFNNLFVLVCKTQFKLYFIYFNYFFYFKLLLRSWNNILQFIIKKMFR